MTGLLDRILSYVAGYRTDVISDIITAASGITITECIYQERCGVAQIDMTWKSSSALSVQAGGTATLDVGTIKKGKRPAMKTGIETRGVRTHHGTAYSYDNATVPGVVRVQCCDATGSARSIAANSLFYTTFTYIVEPR